MKHANQIKPYQSLPPPCVHSSVCLEFRSTPAAGVCDVIILEDQITFFEDESDPDDRPIRVVVQTQDDFLDGEKDYERHTISWVETRIPKRGILDNILASAQGRTSLTLFPPENSAQSSK